MLHRAINDAGLKIVKDAEGLRLTAYADPATHGAPWTIGYGHTRLVRPHMVIKQAEAEVFLHADLFDAESAVSSHVTVSLNENQFSALVSFVFNLGAGVLAHSSLIRDLNKSIFEHVPADLLQYNHAAGRVMPGLTKRRKAEALLFAKPV